MKKRYFPAAVRSAALCFAVSLFILIPANKARSQVAIPNPVCYGDPINLFCNVTQGCNDPNASIHWENWSGSWTSDERDPVIRSANDPLGPSSCQLFPGHGYGTDYFYLSIQYSPPPGGFYGGRVHVVVLPQIILQFNIIQDCSVSSVILTVTGGKPQYTYLWSYNNTTSKDLLNIPAGTYTVTVTDANTCTKTGSVSVTTLNCDFGDLPDGYHTNRESNGARSRILPDPACTIKLGVKIDNETNGQPGPLADGDDTHPAGPQNDDEDGAYYTSIPPCPVQSVIGFDILNTTASVAFLQGWIDYNMDGIFSDLPDEHVIVNQPFSPGTNIYYPASVPCNPNPAHMGPFSARFRLSDRPDAGSSDQSPQNIPCGEVEDYLIPGIPVVNLPYDFGDAPVPYPTKLPNGARHAYNSQLPLRLGNSIDLETEGIPDNNALGDDNNPIGGPDDEDGVAMYALINGTLETNKLFKGDPFRIEVSLLNNTGSNAYLMGWIDYDQSQSWETSEMVVNDPVPSSVSLQNKSYPLTAPLSAVPGATFARFRLSDQPGIGPDHQSGNPIPKGEVEDYRVVLIDECHLDTLLLNTGIDRLNDNSLLNIGSRDHLWEVGFTPYSNTIYDSWVINRHNNWSPALLNSNFLGSKSTSNVDDDDGNYRYDFSFCLNDITQVSLNLSILVDNSAIVSLNGNQILNTFDISGLNGFNPPAGPATISVSTPSFFNLQANVLTVIVNNYVYPGNNPSGFSIEGLITSTNYAIGYWPDCCEKKFVQNEDIISGQSICYDFPQTIAVAGDGTTFTVQEGGSANFIAGQRIEFLPGTTIHDGGHLHGWIAPNGPYCGTLKSAVYEDQPDTVKIRTPLLESMDSFCRMYPNPTTGGFSLELNGIDREAELRVEIYDMLGERVYSGDLKGQKKYDFTLAGKPNGVYFIRVVTGGNTGTAKIVKQ